MTEGAGFSDKQSTLSDLSAFQTRQDQLAELAREANKPPTNDLTSLYNQIQLHESKEDGRSVLAWGVSKIWRKDEGTLDDLQKLAQDIEAAKKKGDTATASSLQSQIAEKVKADRDAQGFQDEVSHYLGGGLKTAALFINGTGGKFLGKAGTVGLVSTMGLYALDQAKVKDIGSSEFYVDMGLGGLKGLALKGTFHGLGQALSAESVATKGISLGLASRFAETALTRETYLGANGQFDTNAALSNFKETLINPRALVQDAALFTMAHGLSRGANFLSGEALAARPFYQNVLTSGTFGISNGAFAELDKQQRAGQGFDYKQILLRGLLQGGVDAIAGAPGGLAADANFRQRPIETLKYDYGVAKNNWAWAAENIRNSARGWAGELADAVMPSGPQFAYAMEGFGPGRDMMGSPPDVVSDRVYMMSSMDGKGAGNTGAADTVRPVERVDWTAPPETLMSRDRTPVTPTTPQEQSFERLLTRAGSENARVQDLHNLYGFMRANPVIDSYAGRVYMERYDQSPVRRALEGFYKPDTFTFEPSLSDPRVESAYQRLDKWMTSPMVRLSPNKMVDYLNDYVGKLDQEGVNLRPVLHQVASTSRDSLLVGVLDKVLQTDYTRLMQFMDKTRALPSNADEINAARQEAQYLYDVATGKIKPPPIDGTEPQQPGGRPVDPADVAKYGVAGRMRALAETPEGTQPSDLVTRANALRDQIVLDTAAKLDSADLPTRRKAIKDLGQQLDHQSAEQWFEKWKEKVVTDEPLGGLLLSPEVQAMPPDVVRRFLGAKSAISSMGGPELPPLQRRLALLASVAETFSHSTEMGALALEQGITNPEALQQILFKLGHPKDGAGYRDLVEQGLIAGRSITELSSDAALNESRALAAFPDAPEIGKKLAAMGASGELQLDPLLRRMSHPKLGEQIKQEVRSRIERGDSAAKIEAERLFGEMLAQRTFANSPEVLVKLLDLADGNPVALQEIVSGPRPPGEPQKRGPRDRNSGPPPRVDKRIMDGYFDLVRELVPQATDISQLQHVLTAVKSGNASIAFEAASKIRPADNNDWLRVQRLIYGIASGDGHAVPGPKQAATVAPEQSRRDLSGAQPIAEPIKVADPSQPATSTGEALPIEPIVIKVPGVRSSGTGDGVVDQAVFPPVAERVAPVAGARTEPTAGEHTEPTAGEHTEPVTAERAGDQQVLPKTDTVTAVSPDQILAERVQRLRDGQATVADIAELGKQLKHPSASEWFDSWRQAAPQSISLGFVLEKPEIQALPPEVVQRFLSADQVPFVEAPQPQRERGGRDGERQSRPRQQPKDTMQTRLQLMSTLLETFSPEAGSKLIELGANNQAALREMLYKVSHPEFGGLYKQMVETQVGQAQDLGTLTRPSAVQEARIMAAFSDAPEVGQVLAEMGAQGQLRLDIVLNRMNNPYFGRTYREVLRDSILDASKEVTTEDINGEKIYLEALAKRSMGRWPETVDRLLEIGTTNSKAMQDVLNAPRERALEPLYRELIRQLAPQATIEQLADISNLVKRGDADGAFQAAIPVRPADTQAWNLTQQIINAVALGDVPAAQAIERQLPRPPRQEGDFQRDNQRGGRRERPQGQRREQGQPQDTRPPADRQPPPADREPPPVDKELPAADRQPPPVVEDTSTGSGAGAGIANSEAPQRDGTQTREEPVFPPVPVEEIQPVTSPPPPTQERVVPPTQERVVPPQRERVVPPQRERQPVPPPRQQRLQPSSTERQSAWEQAQLAEEAQQQEEWARRKGKGKGKGNAGGRPQDGDRDGRRGSRRWQDFEDEE